MHEMTRHTGRRRFHETTESPLDADEVHVHLMGSPLQLEDCRLAPLIEQQIPA